MKDTEGVEGNNNEQKWEKEYELQKYNMRWLGMNEHDLTIADKSIKSFIRQHFLYRPDLIGLVEGIKPPLELQGEFGNVGEWESGYHEGFNYFKATLKDTLSNKDKQV